MFILNNEKQQTKLLDEIGQMMVPRALNDTKAIRKAGADIFAHFEFENPGKIQYQENPQISFVGLTQIWTLGLRAALPRAISTFKRLGPIF